jgi:putative ABC transport system permease protein
MKMILFMAWRNIWRNPVRSLLIMSSVIIGLWAGAFINALYFGMSEDRVRMAIENEVSHLQIHHPEFRQDYKPQFTIGNNQKLKQKLDSIKAIKSASFRSVAQAMLSTASGSAGVMVYGIDPAAEHSTTQLATKIIEGNYFSPEKRNQIIIGHKLASRLKLKLRSRIVISCIDTAGNISASAFKIAGIYRSSNSALDKVNVYVKRESLNQMLGLHQEAHEIAILLHTNKTLEKTKQSLRQQLPMYRTESWKEISPETELIISTMTQFSFIIIIIILLALSFGIVNTMLMAILERSREIGMMLALGMNKSKIFLLILSETCLLVMTGCLPGLLSAWLSIAYFTKTGIDISAFAGRAMSSFGFSTVMYPSLPPIMYIQMALMVACCALISAIFPSLRAIRLNPAETLKR